MTLCRNDINLVSSTSRARNHREYLYSIDGDCWSDPSNPFIFNNNRPLGVGGRGGCDIVAEAEEKDVGGSAQLMFPGNEPTVNL